MFPTKKLLGDNLLFFMIEFPIMADNENNDFKSEITNVQIKRDRAPIRPIRIVCEIPREPTGIDAWKMIRVLSEDDRWNKEDGYDIVSRNRFWWKLAEKMRKGSYKMNWWSSKEKI